MRRLCISCGHTVRTAWRSLWATISTYPQHQSTNHITVGNLPGLYTLCRYIIRTVFHYNFSVFSSVYGVVLPIIHTPYKDNNKVLINYLYY
jgi:hypothetical protein